MAPETLDRCAHSGGTGIGASHECRCVRPAGHALDSDRPHGCTCGALWSDAGEGGRVATLAHLRRLADDDHAWDDDSAFDLAVNPDVVLELIDRLEAAEAKVDEAQRAALTWKRRAEDAEEAVGRVRALMDQAEETAARASDPVTIAHFQADARRLREAVGDPDDDEEVSPGCACTELCSMGPTCPGGVLAGLSAGCADEEPHPLPPGDYIAHLGDGSTVSVTLGEAIPAPPSTVSFGPFRVLVTAAQVAAAKAMVQRLEARAEPVPASVRKIAEAEPS